MTKVQRYKVGYYTDEWGMLIVTPRLIPDDKGFAIRLEDYFKLEAELAALKAELCEICAAIDDPACDLTLTAVECIKKLKAENDGLKLDSASKVVAALVQVARAAWHAADDSEEVLTDYGRAHRITGPDFDELSDALDVLDELPDDQPGYVMNGPARAEWALRNLR